MTKFATGEKSGSIFWLPQPECGGEAGAIRPSQFNGCNVSIQQMQMKWLRQADAEAVAKTNNDNDPEWTYVAQKASDGMWYVAVFDEDGEHLGVL